MPTLNDIPTPTVQKLDEYAGTAPVVALGDLFLTYDVSTMKPRTVSLTEFMTKYDTDYPPA
jgi:hypothetical protein